MINFINTSLCWGKFPIPRKIQVFSYFLVGICDGVTQAGRQVPIEDALSLPFLSRKVKKL